MVSIQCLSACRRSARRLELPLRARGWSVIAAVAARDCCAALEAARASWIASAVLWWPEARGAECLGRAVAKGVGVGVGAAAGVSADGQRACSGSWEEVTSRPEMWPELCRQN